MLISHITAIKVRTFTFCLTRAAMDTVCIPIDINSLQSAPTTDFNGALMKQQQVTQGSAGAKQHVSPAVAIHGHNGTARLDVDEVACLQTVQALEEVPPGHGVVVQHGGLGAHGAGEKGKEVQAGHVHPLPALLAVLLPVNNADFATLQQTD